jgi:hypothetical protein
MDRAARTGQPGQVSRERTEKTGGQNRTVGTRQTGQDKPRQDSLDRTARTR